MLIYSRVNKYQCDSTNFETKATANWRKKCVYEVKMSQQAMMIYHISGGYPETGKQTKAGNSQVLALPI
jgi:hypothetical protein